MGVGGIVGYATMATLKDNLSAADIAKKSSDNYFGAIVGMNMGSTLSNNYYVDGLGIYNTPNTELKAVNGVDTDGQAQLAYVYSSKPDGFGNAVTVYGYGMEAYSAGLHYNTEWYSPIEPLAKDIKLNDTEDNSTILEKYKGVYDVNVTLNRTFVKDGDWNTICLPFTIDDINAEGCPLAGDGVELWQMAAEDEEGNPTGFDEDSGALTLNFKNCYDEDNEITTLIAGYPYLIKWNGSGETISNLVFEDVTITETSPIADTSDDGKVNFTATFANRTFETANRSILFIGANNTLYWPQPSNENIPSIGAFRAYFQLNGITAGIAAGVRIFHLNFGGETTGITAQPMFNVQYSMSNENSWFSIDGRKLTGKPTQRGIYINNGKMTVIK
jgi:hypothetical protein